MLTYVFECMHMYNGSLACFSMIHGFEACVSTSFTLNVYEVTCIMRVRNGPWRYLTMLLLKWNADGPSLYLWVEEGFRSKCKADGICVSLFRKAIQVHNDKFEP